MKRIISGFTAGGWLLLFLTTVCIMSISSPVFSADEVIARLTSFSGTVLIKSQGSWDVKPEINLPLYSEDKVVTKMGVATITFDDGAVMDIRPNSNLLVKESEEEGTGIGETVKVVNRKLRLFLGKMFFKTGRGSRTKTTLETTTMVCGLRGTEGFLSIDASGQTYLEFTEGGGDTIGDFISGVAADVPTELASLNPVQRAAFVAAAAADQATQAAEAAATGQISDADAALAAARAAKAAAQEAKAAAEAMLSNPDPEVQEEAATVIEAADQAILDAEEVEENAIESGATPPAEGEATEEIGFDAEAEVTDYSEWGLEEEDRRVRDIIPPTILVSMQPALYTNSDTAIFEFSVDDNITTQNMITVSYTIDGGELVELEAPGEEGLAELDGALYVYTIDFSDLTERQHQIIITATDEEGNITTTSYLWTTDYTSPIALIPTKPNVIANTSTFGFSATDTNANAGITYQYSLDGGTWTTTAASLNLGLATDGSADGSRTISVKATDAAGNTGATASYTWTYDTIAPVVSIPEATRPAVIANTSSFGFSATDANAGEGITYEYSLNSGAWTTTDTALNLSLTATTGTAYTIGVRATDAAGNTGTSVTYTWTYDNVFPTFVLSASPDASGATITASHTNIEPGTVSYDYGGTNTGLVDGDYTFNVTATDQAGNVSPIQTYTFSLDLSFLDGDIYGTGSVITGYAEGASVTVEGQDWGGWETSMSGDWSGSHTGTLSLISGGYADEGYWLSKMSGSIDTATGDATGTSDFTILTTENLTTGAGTFTASFLTDNTWSGTETGSGLVATPLALSGPTVEGSGFLYWGGTYMISSSSYIEGLLGGTDLFTGYNSATSTYTPSQIVGIGQYDPISASEYRLFWSEFVGGGVEFGADGYFYLLSFGNKGDDGDIKGNMVGLYINPDQVGGYDAGILKSDVVTGMFYEDIGMWEIPYGSNSLTAQKMASLSTMPNILYSGVDATLVGDITGIFEIESRSFYVGDQEEDWGIWYGLGGGTYAGSPTAGWSAVSGFEETDDLGMVNGYDIFNFTGTDWSSERLAGTVTGQFINEEDIGTVTGDLLGVYDTGGGWEASGTGTWEAEPLAWNGMITSGSFGGWDGEHVTFDTGDPGYIPLSPIEGLIGSTDSLFTGYPAQFIGLGMYDPASIDDYMLFASSIEGGGVDFGADGYYDITFGGIRDNADIEGMMLGLYVRPDGAGGYDAGIIGSDVVTGALYEDIGMWEIPYGSGSLTAQSKASLTTLPTAVESDDEMSTPIAGDITGNLDINSMSFYVGADEEDWGVWTLGGGGTYAGSPTAGWSAVSGFEETDDLGLVYGYDILNFTGTDWSSGRIAGTVTGQFINEEDMGTINGDLMGLYDTGGGWEALGIGTWEAEPLAFSSNFAPPGGLFRMFDTTDYEAEYVAGIPMWEYYDYNGDGDYDDPGETTIVGTRFIEYEYTYFLADSYFDFSGEIPVVSDVDTILAASRDLDEFGYSDFSKEETYLPYKGPVGTGLTLVYDDGTIYFAPWSVADLDTATFTNPTDLAVIDPNYDITLTTWSRNFYSEDQTNVLAQSGEFSGIMGGTGDLWSGSPTDISLLGIYEPWDGDISTPSLFNEGIRSSGEILDLGGAYSGTIFGAVDSSVNGKVIALYVRDDGSGGILSGDFSGSTYQDLGMWDGTGSLTATQLTADTGITPAEFMPTPPSPPTGAITHDLIYGHVGGDFGSSGSFIENEFGWGQTSFITDNNDWGIFDLFLGIGNYFNNPGGSGTWTARAGGGIATLSDYQGYWMTDEMSGTASNGILSADVTGKALTLTHYADLSADLVGTYDETGDTWQAMMGGYWNNSQVLYFSGEIDGGLGLATKVYSGNGNTMTSMGPPPPGGPGSYDSYSYNYQELFGNGWSNFHSVDPATTTYTSYNPDGTYEEWSLISSEAPSYYEGTWSGNLLDYLEATLDSYSYPNTGSFESYNLAGTGWIEGNMGGLEPLWTATESDPADIIMLGEFDLDDEYGDFYMPSIFVNEIESSNPYEMNDTIWNEVDQATIGAYNGYSAGITLSETDTIPIQGSILALYLDNGGNAGYLRGAFNGDAYQDAGVWGAMGSVYPEQVESSVGILPENLSYAYGAGSVYSLSGQLGSTGTIDYDSTGGRGGLPGPPPPGMLPPPVGQSLPWAPYETIGLETLSIIDATSSNALPWGIYSGAFAGSFENPESAATWTSQLGGYGYFGAYFYDYGGWSNDMGYYIMDTSGTWTGGILSGDQTGDFLTQTKMGTIDGDVLGTYNDTYGTWQATGLGTWTGTDDLAFASEFYSSMQYAALFYSGEYSYSGGGYFYYQYSNDVNTTAYSEDHPTSDWYPYTYTNYYTDGTTYLYGYDEFGNWLEGTSGTWLDTGLTMAEVVSTPTPPVGETYELSYTDEYPSPVYSGNLNGIMGGTSSLWSGTDLPVTLMGTYYPGDRDKSIWYYNDLYSYNYKNDTFTTYDNGAYYGSAGGIMNNDDLEGLLVAIYIDPDGNAGYLTGDLSGYTDPDAWVFEMDGAINRTEMVSAAELGISAGDLYYNITDGWANLSLSGDFSGTGSIVAENSSYMDLYSITGQPWGTYSGNLYGFFENPGVATGWTSRVGGSGSIDNEYYDNLYIIAETASTWENGVLDASLNGRFLSNTLMGDITGDVLGTYSGTTDGLWEAVSLGTWEGVDLQYVSNLGWPGLSHGVYAYRGEYRYSGDTYSSYSYDYNPDNVWGSVSYYSDGDGSLPYDNYYINYNSDGTYHGYNWATDVTISGNWVDEEFDLASITNPPAQYGTDNYLVYDDTYGTGSDVVGNMPGLMGGTTSLWTESNIAVTLMGNSYPYDYESVIGHNIWGNFTYSSPHNYNNSFSYNYKNDTYTTYDNGAYYAAVGGIRDDNEDLQGLLAALYIDPSGNAGYLTGDLSGYVDPDIEMYEMDGAINRAQVVPAGELGIDAWTFYGNVLTADSYPILSGSFDGTGSISGDSIYLELSNIIGEPWGIYNASIYGDFIDKPTGVATWNSRMGGWLSLPVEMAIYSSISGENLYSSESEYASLYYHYSDDNSWGHVSYYCDGTGTLSYADYYIDYSWDGTYYGYDNATDTPISGYWDPGTENIADIVTAVPAEWGTNWYNSYEYIFPYSVNSDGHFIAETTGTWGNGMLGASLNGRFLTETHMGDISGDLLGTYSGTTDGLWEAVSLGTFDGSELAFASSYLAPSINNTTRRYHHEYTTINGDQYNYWYSADNYGGYVYFYDYDIGTYTEIYFNGNGEAETYDSSTGQWTYGAWDPETQDLSIILAQLPDVGDTWTLYSSYEDVLFDSVGHMGSALMGGTDSLWTGSDIPVTLMGGFSDYFGTGHGIWTSDIYSHNYQVDTDTTYDGGAYWGYVGGISLENGSTYSLEGGLTALYIDNAGNAGLLTGPVTGSAYPDIEMFEMDGTINRVEMVNGIGIAAGDLTGNIVYDNPYLYGGGSFDAGGYISVYDSVSYINSIVGQELDWGIWSSSIYGEYEDTTSDIWYMNLYDGSNTLQIGISGTQWSDGKMVADAAGYYVDVSAAMTGVMGGEVIGTFDPSTFTWEAVSSGAWIETTRFLDMADPGNTIGNEALEALNIPYIEMGRTDLSGYGGDLTSVNMNDVRFYSYSTGAEPKIWATGDVNGATNGYDLVGDTAVLNGTGFSGVNFTIDSYNATVGGTWNANVNGSGTVGTYDVGIQGGAAGSVDTDSGTGTTFSGTGAGIVGVE